MSIGKTIDKILSNLGKELKPVPEIVIKEGMMLSVNKVVSDSIKIPEGDYIIWAINADTCQLMPTSESMYDIVEISRPALKGFYNPEVHKKIVDKSKGTINENG